MIAEAFTKNREDGIGPSEFEPQREETNKPHLMSKEELFDLHRATSASCLATMEKKNHDYTSGGSVFANFNSSREYGIHPAMGILLRIGDKFKRIQTFVTKGALLVEGEGALDSIDDAINYLILMKGILIEEQRNAK